MNVSEPVAGLCFCLEAFQLLRNHFADDELQALAQIHQEPTESAPRQERPDLVEVVDGIPHVIVDLVGRLALHFCHSSLAKLWPDLRNAKTHQCPGPLEAGPPSHESCNTCGPKTANYSFGIQCTRIYET